MANPRRRPRSPDRFQPASPGAERSGGLESGGKEAAGSNKQDFRLIVESFPGFVCTTTASGEIEFVNRRILDYLGQTIEESKDWRRTLLHEDDWERVVQAWSRSIENGDTYDIEHRIRRFDGSFRWFHVRGLPLRGADGRIVRWYMSLVDIDEQKRAEALLAGENRLLAMVAKGEPLASILSGICRLVEEISSGTLCSILLVDPKGDRFLHGVAPSLPASYLSSFEGSAIGPEAAPCARAVYFREPVIVCDIEADRKGNEYRDLALEHGLRACWSTPFFSSEGRALGSFAMLSREPGCPTEEHHKIINQVTHLTAVAIESQRTEEELQRSEAYLAEAQKLSRTGSFGWRVDTGEVVWSEETFSIMGYDRSIKPTLDLILKRVHPDDLILVQETMDHMTRNGTDLDFEHRLLMPDGTVKHAHVVARATKAESSAIEYVGALMDITERKEAAESLKASEKLARGQVEALKSALEALATEPAPERLVEHILRTLTEQFGAHSSSVLRRDEAKGLIVFEFAYEDGHIVTKTDPRFAGIDLSFPMKDFWPWPEAFRTGKVKVVEDIRDVPPCGMRDRLMRLGIVTAVLIPMWVVGRLMGGIVLRFTQKRVFRTEETELAQALANQAMLAMQLTHLSEESRETAVIAERNRMARDIHDTLAQGFTGVIMQLEAAKGANTHGDLSETVNRIERASELARLSLGEARRSVRALRPRSLRDGKLFLVLHGLLKRMTEGTNLNAEFRGEGDARDIPTELEEGLLRITQEALTNAVKHANARNFTATLSVDALKILLRLVDDGSGFDPHAPHEGFGLVGMRERVAQMGGEFIIRSKPEVGTEILVELGSQAAEKMEFGNEEG